MTEDRTIRGLFYLIAWFAIVPFALAAVGTVLFGVPGIILGLLIATGLGVWGFAAYLNRGL